jgi:CRP/FNR family transcriptional regulator
MDRESILETVAFYREAPAELQSRIAAAARYVNLPPGTWLFEEGDPSDEIALIGKGSVRVFRVGTKGREITLYHVREQQSSMVNMLAVLLGSPAIAAARVEVATEAVVIPAVAFRDWVSTNEQMRQFVYQSMIQALVEVTTLLEDVAFSSMESRLAVLLLQHFATTEVLSTTHEDIAAELGTAREVVSRLMENYERRGAIRLSRGRVELRDGAVLGRLI